MRGFGGHCPPIKDYITNKYLPSANLSLLLSSVERRLQSTVVVVTTTSIWGPSRAPGIAGLESPAF